MKTIAILGLSPQTAKFVRHSKADEIWTINRAWQLTKEGRKFLKEHYPDRLVRNPKFTIPRISRLYDPHTKEYLKRECPDQWHWLCEGQRKYPVYLAHHYPEVGLSYQYRFDRFDAFDYLKRGNKRNILVSSGVAFILLEAIFDSLVSTIEIYGVDLKYPFEYAMQREGFALLVGLAMGREKTIKLHSRAEILQPTVYGFQTRAVEWDGSS